MQRDADTTSGTEKIMSACGQGLGKICKMKTALFGGFVIVVIMPLHGKNITLKR